MPALNYSDIYLVPNYSELRSRADADVSVEFLGRRWAAPICAANMSSVIDEKIAKWCSENDVFYIMHRFGDTIAFVEKASAENWKTVSISIGVKTDDKILIDWFERGVCYAEMFKRKQLKIDFVTIDVAHGDHKLVKEMIEFVRQKLPKAKVIAGNIATPQAIRRLTEWGADAVKIGIAGGAACSTKTQTGFHIPMFSCVKNCDWWGGGRYVVNGSTQTQARIPIIADGGIKENGDIAKALVAGATMIMAGSMFAACIDGPGENVYHPMTQDALRNGYSLEDIKNTNFSIDVRFKRYHGSASEKQKGERRHVEGFELDLPCNGLTFAEKIAEIKESLSSAISYSGGQDLFAFKNVQWIEA